MKDLKLSLSDEKLKVEMLEVKDSSELLSLVQKNFSDGALALLETPKSCFLEPFSGSSEHLKNLNALTVCSKSAELRAEKNSSGFAVRILSDTQDGEAVLSRQVECYLRAEIKASAEKILVKEYFVLDEQTGMPVKQYERMCGAA